MKPLVTLLLVPFTLVHSLTVPREGWEAMAHQSAGTEKTASIVDAALAFLDLLEPDGTTQALMPYEFQEKAEPTYFPHPKMKDFFFVGEQYGKSVWTNFPISDVPRSGLRLGDMTPSQHDAAFKLLRVALSDRGYSKVQDILSADQALADQGQNFASGRANYVLGIFGQPTLEDVWMIQFGGHHLGLNIALNGAEAALAPVLTGAQPTNYDASKRALAAENDKAFTLLHSLTDSQLDEAVIKHPVSDLITGPGEDLTTIPDAGVRVSTFDSKQRDLLFDLIREWAGILNDVHAAPRLAELEVGLDETFFAWSGPQTHQPDRNGESYFRITGPNLIIESAPQFPGGDLTQHVHTVYRDHIRAYGRSFVTSRSQPDGLKQAPPHGSNSDSDGLQKPLVAP
ncbi:hypothetical protein N0V93_000879 [Gnomoniopsis smithogilvyi]|uniref:DUF3500 domain-containing protein n=1 Tax=Gnomoniopsis smithogilvyi TaxID=1191159 RepID=A0A9W8Z2M7_9PEZI|nr:hypothetical protein N0V93_000879 [Gnomoniopsis smithogilvyi]